MKVLLMGNPNVGKSVIFSRLTGTNVVSSNYAGTTVEYTKGHIKWKNEIVEIIDVPGTYTLNPTNKAEEVAVQMLKEGDLIVNVVDATNLERNLNLTLQLLEKDIPMIISLNLWDEAQHKGIMLDIDKLRDKLGVPIIPTIAVKGNGIKEIIDYFDYDKIVKHNYGDANQRWAKIGEIIKEVQKIDYKSHSFLDILEDISIKPLTGLPLAIFILYISFSVIRFIGEGLITYVTEPFFEYLYKPLMLKLSVFLGSGGFIHNILVGELINGDIDFEQSFGLLTTGIHIPIGAVLPYIVSFYLILGLLEDTGYLPRISVLVDNIMHKVGLHGFSIIPMILGFGCNVPAALAIRNLESTREKFIATTLMSIAIPCISQTAMIIALLGPYGNRYIFYVFATLLVVWIIVGSLLNKLIPGFSSDLLLEIPSFRIPSIKTIFKKLQVRILGFLREAIPLMIFGVFIINIFYTIGVFDMMASTLGPFLNKAFGLPDQAINALLMGFLRKDLAMGVLMPMGLNPKQMLTISILLVIYFPCIATFVVLIRELGVVNMLKATVIMLISTFLVGVYINFAFQGERFSLIRLSIIVLLFIIIQMIPKRKDKEKILHYNV